MAGGDEVFDGQTAGCLVIGSDTVGVQRRVEPDGGQVETFEELQEFCGEPVGVMDEHAVGRDLSQDAGQVLIVGEFVVGQPADGQVEALGKELVVDALDEAGPERADALMQAEDQVHAAGLARPGCTRGGIGPVAGGGGGCEDPLSSVGVNARAVI